MRLGSLLNSKRYFEQPLVGLRNLLVRDCETIDDERIYTMATTELGDFDRFAGCILDYLGR